MSEKDNHIMPETKPITSLVIDYDQRVHDWNPCVGSNGVTKIERADEKGEMAMVPWFAIYLGNDVVWRINGKYVVEVSYDYCETNEAPNLLSHEEAKEFLNEVFASRGYTQAQLDAAVEQARSETWEAATKAAKEILVGNHGMFTVFNWIKDRFEVAAAAKEK